MWHLRISFCNHYDVILQFAKSCQVCDQDEDDLERDSPTSKKMTQQHEYEVTDLEENPENSCELDTFPTKPLKVCIDSILPTIMSLVNISLRDGVFASRWKSSIIRHLLKKSTMDLISSSYYPVINLSFLSKLLKNVPCTVSMSFAISTSCCHIISQPIAIATLVKLQL